MHVTDKTGDSWVWMELPDVRTSLSVWRLSSLQSPCRRPGYRLRVCRLDNNTQPSGSRISVSETLYSAGEADAGDGNNMQINMMHVKQDVRFAASA